MVTSFHVLHQLIQSSVIALAMISWASPKLGGREKLLARFLSVFTALKLYQRTLVLLIYGSTTQYNSTRDCYTFTF